MKLTPIQLSVHQWGVFAPEEGIFVLSGTRQDVERALLRSRRTPAEVRRAFERADPRDLHSALSTMRRALPAATWWRHLAALQALGAPIAEDGTFDHSELEDPLDGEALPFPARRA